MISIPLLSCFLNFLPRNLKKKKEKKRGFISQNNSILGCSFSSQISVMDLEHGSGSGSSKHSESHSESHSVVIDGSASSDHEDTYPKLRVRVGSSDNLQRDPEKIDGAESSKNSESNPEFINGSVSSKQREFKLEFTVTEGDLYMQFVKSGSSSSSPSSAPSLSSSNSSLYDLFDVITKERSNPEACIDFESPNKPHEITQSASEDHENDTSIDNSHKSKESEGGSSDHTLTFPVSDVPLESQVHNISPTQSPPLQVMERPGGYDPFRIPSSIFESNKGPAPMDWSVASNESLFSIHVGNNSFSRDHVLLFGDLGLSGDITRSGELIMFSPPPPKAMVATDNQSSDPSMGTDKQKGGANGVADNTIKDPAEYKNEENKPSQAVSWKSPRTSSLSYESGDSVESFSFPIRKKKYAWPWRYFSSCSWALCYCKRPSCYFRWPSCSCSYCSWAFCYYWKCGRKGCCCHKYSVLANGMINGSLKAGTEQRHLESAPAPVSQKSDSCRWCRCFSCCSWRCSFSCCCSCRKIKCCC